MGPWGRAQAWLTREVDRCHAVGVPASRRLTASGLPLLGPGTSAATQTQLPPVEQRRPTHVTVRTPPTPKPRRLQQELNRGCTAGCGAPGPGVMLHQPFRQSRGDLSTVGGGKLALLRQASFKPAFSGKTRSAGGGLSALHREGPPSAGHAR